MHKKARFSSLPNASGGIARAAYARALEARLEVGLLLKYSSLTPDQIEDSHFRMPVENQIKFLNVIANELPDPFLGIHVAKDIDLRQIGLVYYVIASSRTLGEALARLARYSGITNEGLRITCHELKDITLKFEYVGVSRLSDRHQIECFVAILVRICRQLTGLNLSPKSVRFVHRRAELPAGVKKVFGCNVAFASNVDEVVYPRLTKGIATVNADPYLNSLLVRYCEEALSNRQLQSSAWRLKVENAIVPLLPHGQAKIREIAKRVGVSERTLMRLLASEGCTFTGILDALRLHLARSYLREQNLPISEVAWLLGFQELGAFFHDCKRWTGRTPKQLRSAGVRF
ncbi:MAG: AraC family transcriptional regulator ligand-binding domain-containing protein [Xanthobacteraceae bacterium]